MAVIGRIRKHSGLLVTIIGIALLAFIVGMSKSDFGWFNQRPDTNIGEINGRKISYIDFDKKVSEQIENIKERSKKDNLTEEEDYQAKQMTWTQMTKEMILGEEYNDLGITVSPDELFDLVQGKNPHQYILQYFKDPNTNQYNPQLVINFLKQLDQMEPKQKNNWLILEKAIKDDRLQTKFNNLLGKGYYLPKAFLMNDYQEKNRKFDLRLVAGRYQNIDDKTITVTDADYQKYYNEHKYMFDQPEETRDIDYVSFDLVPSATDQQKIAADVDSIYRDFQTATDVPKFVNDGNSDTRYDSTWFGKNKLMLRLDTFLFNAPVGTIVPPFVDNEKWYMAKLLDVQMRPDSMKASHILIAFKGSAVNDNKITRTKEKAKQIADSILAVVQKDMNQFPPIAMKMSDDGSNKNKGGELDWFVDGAMVWPFNQACLEANVNDFKVVETVFGYHVIHVTGKTVPQKKLRVAIVDRRIEPSSQTIQEIYNKSTAFAGENTTLDAFNKTVTSKGFNKKSADGLRAMDASLPGLTNSRRIVQWAFTKETEKGTVSTVFEVKGSYVVAVLKEIRPKGLLPLDLVKKQIEGQVKNIKKSEKLMAQMNSAGTKDLYQLAAKMNTQVDTIKGLIFYSPNLMKFGPEPELVGKVVTLKPSAVVGPLRGEQAVYMVQLDSIHEAPPVTDMKMVSQQALMMFGNRAQMDAYKALEKLSDIEDNRVRFY